MITVTSSMGGVMQGRGVRTFLKSSEGFSYTFGRRSSARFFRTIVSLKKSVFGRAILTFIKGFYYEKDPTTIPDLHGSRVIFEYRAVCHHQHHL